jgi:HlyD family secretion protein
MFRDTSAQDRPVDPRHTRRRRIAAIAVVGAVALAGLALAAPTLQRLLASDGAVSASRLVLASVERGPFVRDVAGEGQVVAAVSATLYAPAAGAATLKVQAGDRVRQGQVLAQIDSPELAARLAQETSNAEALRADARRAEVDARQQRAALQGAYDNARIDKATAENNLARQQKAFEAGAVPGMQVDQARDALAKAAIALQQATEGLQLRDDSLKLDVQSKQLAHARQLLQVQELQRQQAALQLRSPVDGQVGQLLVAERAQVARDAPLLTVVDLRSLEVQMQVAESFARDLAVGMAGEISGAGQTWKARVSAISPEVVNNQVAARLRFEGGTPTELRQNQRLSVRVLLDRRDDVLTVARGSFVDEGGGRIAYVLKDGQAERRAVRLGAHSLQKVEVLEGLRPGERVVIAGTEHFRGAERVTVAP